jgi:DNA mismatch repair protein MutS2
VNRTDALGWDTFRTLLARFAATALGRERAMTLAPASSIDDARQRLADTGQARRARAEVGDPPWDGTTDIRPALAQAAVEGAVLDGPSLAALGRTLAAARALAAYGRAIARGAPRLADQLRHMPLAEALAAALAHDLDAEGRLLDRASPRLGALRRQLQALRAEVEARLEALVGDPVLGAALQDRYVTVRNGRYVVPVRGDARRRIRGIVHDRSQSGATLFVEPEQVVDLNNRLTRYALAERDEEHRLLRQLTHRVRSERAALEALVETLAELDGCFARAALADRLEATEPEILEDGDLELPAARHPLLVAQRWDGGDPVVPVDLRLPADRRALLVTGPNAGGKTVALGTLGLLVVMAHAGCHLPAAAPSRVFFVDRVLAVIGDEQSLAQDLSTFSSFVVQMREILATATRHSLVLLDELGAGTDPAEGAALGIALIETLLDAGARVVATTHLEPLKVFAETDPRALNASVAFDTERLEPAFRLEYGRPGPSYALTIAERLALPAAVVERARAHLSEDARRLDTLIASLRDRERDAEARAADAQTREADARRLLADARRALDRATEDALRLRRDAETEARTVLRDARQRAGRELDRLKAQEATRREAGEAYRRLQAAEARIAPVAAGAATVPAGPGTGDVELRGLGLRGRVVAEQGDLVTVRAGSLTVRVPRSAVEAATDRPPVRATPAGRVLSRSPARPETPRELHLLGSTTDEARAAVDKFLDDAILAGHHTVRLVHGKGTGALRRAVADCLRGHPLVSAFRTAEPRDGGTGVTLVELHEEATA